MQPPPIKKHDPPRSESIDFEAVSLDSARAVLDELPDDIAAQLDAKYWTKVRRAPLATDRALTEATLAWVSELPEALRPLLTCERYPRVVNAIANSWNDPQTRLMTLDHLVNDRRRGRRGFPLDTAAEISALRLYASGMPR
jgi:membrane-associated phospholipid phosphatase